jgi:hypothetical protein
MAFLYRSEVARETARIALRGWGDCQYPDCRTHPDGEIGNQVSVWMSKFVRAALLGPYLTAAAMAAILTLPSRTGRVIRKSDR